MVVNLAVEATKLLPHLLLIQWLGNVSCVLLPGSRESVSTEAAVCGVACHTA